MLVEVLKVAGQLLSVAVKPVLVALSPRRVLVYIR
jgi:hypothetical protein